MKRSSIDHWLLFSVYVGCLLMALVALVMAFRRQDVAAAVASTILAMLTMPFVGILWWLRPRRGDGA